MNFSFHVFSISLKEKNLTEIKTVCQHCMYLLQKLNKKIILKLRDTSLTFGFFNKFSFFTKLFTHTYKHDETINSIGAVHIIVYSSLVQI